MRNIPSYSSLRSFADIAGRSSHYVRSIILPEFSSYQPVGIVSICSAASLILVSRDPIATVQLFLINKGLQFASRPGLLLYAPFYFTLVRCKCWCFLYLISRLYRLLIHYSVLLLSHVNVSLLAHGVSGYFC